MIALQASLICKPSFSHITCLKQRLQLSVSSHSRSASLSSSLPFCTINSTAQNSPFCRHRVVFSCALHPDNVNSSPESNVSGDNSILNFEEQKINEFGGEFPGECSGIESKVSVSQVEESGNVGSEVQTETKVENSVDKVDSKSRLPVVVFLMGLLAAARKGFEKFLLSDWFNWWPFWRQEKRLERLTAEADANPKDAEKQSALLAELNKHSPESVVKHFEQRDHAVDSIGVAEYIRALVNTNAIAEYLPDEQSGKPSSLPTLLQELKQRASGNMDEPLLSPGTSARQPLHVVMVDGCCCTSKVYW